jgi:signal transduction histidine kinase
MCMAHTSTILIVDDEPSARATLEALFTGQGYNLAFACNGAEALHQAAKLAPDVILLDVMMPNMDGFEVCRRLRADPLLAEIPIILITALDDHDSLLYGLEAGADDFISKPFDRIELRTRVQNIAHLNRYRQLSEERAKHAEQLQALSRQLIEMQEAERRHIARELHDEIGQVLTAVKTNLQAIQLRPDPPTLASRLAESINIVDHALKQVRDLSLDLRPSLLDDFGLAAALEWYVERQAQRCGFKADLVIEPPEVQLPSALETACFRVAQAALTNVARHAHAQYVQVELRQYSVQSGGSELQLRIQDDGIGFDVQATLERATRGASMGLLGMQERVRLVGGQFEIESAPGQGTEIRACFPIQE